MLLRLRNNRPACQQKPWPRSPLCGLLAALLMLCARFLAAAAPAPSESAAAPAPPTAAPAGFEFIDTSFENASPLWYDFDPDGTIKLHLLYDNERSSVNRAAGHFHFLLHGKTGAHFTLEFKNLDNIWNGRPSSIANELKTAVISTNGREWKTVKLEDLSDNRVQLKIEMPGPGLYVARLEPYRLSDLDLLLGSLKSNPLVQVQVIGKTVEGRPLEIVRIGSPEAQHRVFVRARAHAWEAGSSWVAQGLVHRLLLSDELARQYRARYCVYLLPMANKDAVAHGRTRFNLLGKDLNRDWDKPANQSTAPENFALEQWLQAMVTNGLAPQLAMELHNDGSGRLHLSRPPGPKLQAYLGRMKTLEQLLRKDTWFTEGSTEETFRNPGSLGEGWFERYGVDAVIHELNCNWIAGLKDYPSARHWEEYGASLATVFYEYFGLVKP